MASFGSLSSSIGTKNAYGVIGVFRPDCAQVAVFSVRSICSAQLLNKINNTSLSLTEAPTRTTVDI